MSVAYGAPVRPIAETTTTGALPSSSASVTRAAIAARPSSVGDRGAAELHDDDGARRRRDADLGASRYSPISFSSPTRGRFATPTSRQASTTPGMKLVRSMESWRMVSVWPCPPKMTSWCATRPGRRTECTVTPSTRRAARALKPVELGLASRDGGRLGARGSDHARRADRGARGRVGLLVVMELDDLDVRHEARGALGELHHEHGADREVRREEQARAGVRAVERQRAPRASPRRARSCPRRSRRRRRARCTGCPRRRRVREVDHDVGVACRRSRPRATRGTRSCRPRRRRSHAPAAPGSTAATTSMPSAAVTARTTSEPMRPAAPDTSTRIIVRCLLDSRFAAVTAY